VKISLTAKQAQAIDYLEDHQPGACLELYYGGAAGGGKGFLGCYWQIKNRLRYPATRGLIARKVLKDLRTTTLNTFFDVAYRMGLQDGAHYRYNQQTGIISFYNGSEIVTRDLAATPSDPDFNSLGSLELTDAFVDEAPEITERCRDVVRSRIRYKLDEYQLKPKMLLCGNPSLNWPFRDFYDADRRGTIEPWRRFLPALPADNPHLPKEYIESLKKLNMIDRERLMLGLWEYSSDPQRLIEYDAILDLFTNDFAEDDGKRYITADIATHGADLFVVTVWSGWRVLRVKTMEKSNGRQILDLIKMTAQEYKVPRSRIAFDSDGVGDFLGGFLGPAVNFKNGGSPIKTRRKDQPNYANLKTQCAFLLAEKVNAREIWVPEEALPYGMADRLRTELLWIKRDKIDTDGKLYLLRKEEVKEGLGRSPDLADTLIMRMIFDIKPAYATGGA
jgi:phage terminase large subunit